MKKITETVLEKLSKDGYFTIMFPVKIWDTVGVRAVVAETVEHYADDIDKAVRMFPSLFYDVRAYVFEMQLKHGMIPWMLVDNKVLIAKHQAFLREQLCNLQNMQTLILQNRGSAFITEKCMLLVVNTFCPEAQQLWMEDALTLSDVFLLCPEVFFSVL